MDDNIITLINNSLSEEDDVIDLQSELDNLINRVLTMGGMVERALQKAIKGLVNSDSATSRAVIISDSEINALEKEIDRECTRLIAEHHPNDESLDLIMSIVRTITDIERIGDESENIAHIGVKTATEGGIKERHKRQVQLLAGSVKDNLRDAFNAMARQDGEAAFNVIKYDKGIDEDYEGALRQMLTYMMEDPRNIQSCIDVIWVVRSLERIGDHVKNIAEHVLYLKLGEDITKIKIKDHSSYTELLESIERIN